MTETLPIGPLYEPPRIERVLTPEDLAREVQYAGQEVSSFAEPPPTE
jgi:hypothetical protein